LPNRPHHLGARIGQQRRQAVARQGSSSAIQDSHAFPCPSWTRVRQAHDADEIVSLSRTSERAAISKMVLDALRIFASGCRCRPRAGHFAAAVIGDFDHHRRGRSRRRAVHAAALASAARRGIRVTQAGSKAGNSMSRGKRRSSSPRSARAEAQLLDAQ